MKTYRERKESVRQHAMEWKHTFDWKNYDYLQLCIETDRFERLARQYGLVREFRENGII